MKKIVSLILCIAMLLSCVSFAAAEDVTITVAHNQGEYIYEKFHQLGDKFTEMTGVKIEWLEIPSSDWDTWVTAQFAAQTEPDVLWAVPSAKDYFDQGKLVDLTPYYDQRNTFNGKVWKDCFTPGGLDNTMSNDGTRYIATAMTYAKVDENGAELTGDDAGFYTLNDLASIEEGSAAYAAIDKALQTIKSSAEEAKDAVEEFDNEVASASKKYGEFTDEVLDNSKAWKGNKREVASALKTMNQNMSTIANNQYYRQQYPGLQRGNIFYKI